MPLMTRHVRAGLTALVAGALLIAPTVQAQAPALQASAPIASGAANAFPVTLLKTAYEPPAPGIVLVGYDDGGLRLTWRSNVPGLSFCVAYATARGLYADSDKHCLVADRHGEAVDTVRLGHDRDVTDLSNAVLVANVILVDNRVSATVVPTDAWTRTAIKPAH